MTRAPPVTFGAKERGRGDDMGIGDWLTRHVRSELLHSWAEMEALEAVDESQEIEVFNGL